MWNNKFTSYSISQGNSNNPTQFIFEFIFPLLQLSQICRINCFKDAGSIISFMLLAKDRSSITSLIFYYVNCSGYFTFLLIYFCSCCCSCVAPRNENKLKVSVNGSSTTLTVILDTQVVFEDFEGFLIPNPNPVTIFNQIFYPTNEKSCKFLS